MFTDLVDRAMSLDVSDSNLERTVLLAKQYETQKELAFELGKGTSEQKITELLEEVIKLRAATTLAEVEEVEELEIFDKVDIRELLTKEVDPSGKISVYPLAVNRALGGGVLAGHHLVVFGRPESGKSALAISIACGFARQNLLGLYVINEDRPESILGRMAANLSGLPLVPESIEEIANKAEANGLNNIVVLSAAPGNFQQVEEAILKYKPQWLVIDQLRNMSMKAENRTNQLEAAASAARKMAKKHKLVVVSVTQAGDSASGKQVLEMGDVDSSNTGIPAQADVMLGVGVDEQLEKDAMRVISMPKNKITGTHDTVPVRLQAQLSRMVSV